MARPMANDPPFATLNHVTGDLGIPSESDFPRIGITGLCRMRTESLAGLSPRTGKRIFGRQRRRAPIRFRTVFVSRRDRERAIRPAPNRGKSRVFREDGELGVSAGLRGGAERWGIGAGRCG